MSHFSAMLEPELRLHNPCTGGASKNISSMPNVTVGYLHTSAIDNVAVGVNTNLFQTHHKTFVDCPGCGAPLERSHTCKYCGRYLF